MDGATLLGDAGQSTDTANPDDSGNEANSPNGQDSQSGAENAASGDQSTQDEGKKGNDSDKGDQANDQPQEKPGAPEKYEFKVPEGQALDQGIMGAFSEAAKELNLSQDDAQKVIDKVAPVLQARQAEVLSKAVKDWGDASMADKEFGGDKLQQNISIAKKAMDTFGTPELKSLLNDSGLGNHPEVIRAFYRAGLTIKEDSIINGKGTDSSNRTIEQRMYPDMYQ